MTPQPGFLFIVTGRMPSRHRVRRNGIEFDLRNDPHEFLDLRLLDLRDDPGVRGIRTELTDKPGRALIATAQTSPCPTSIA